MDFDVKITGLKELTDTLKQLPEKIQQGAIRAGLRAGANIIKAEAQKRVRVKGQYQPNVTVSEAKQIINRYYYPEAIRDIYLEKHLIKKANRQGRELTAAEERRIEKASKKSEFLFQMEADISNEIEWNKYSIRDWRKFVRTYLNKPRKKLP